MSQPPSQPPVPGVPDGATPPRSGLAIASFILGLLFFVPPAPLVGLVLGIIALSKISSARGAIGGRGLAIAGVVLGAVFVALMCMAAPMAAILLPTLSRARTQVLATSSKNNLKQLGLGVLMYENDYQVMPTSLQVLYDEGYMKDPNIFKHPGSPIEVANENIDGSSSYYYFAPPAMLGEDGEMLSSDIPIMWEKDFWNPGNKINVLFIDGHVELADPDRLRNFVEEYGDLYTVPPEVPGLRTVQPLSSGTPAGPP